jgi:hypothetical protein
VNTYRANNVNWPLKTSEISKIVLDLDDKENPDKTVQDARKMVEILTQLGYEVITLRSGQKGLHVHIKTEKMTDPQIDMKIYYFFKTLAEKLDITTFDEKVIKDQTARITRIPYTKHPKSEKLCIPVDVFSSDKIDEMTVPDISTLRLKSSDGKIESNILSIPIIKVDKPSTVMQRKWKPAIAKEINWNIMDKVFSYLYGEGNNRGDKYITLCPFHDDHHPSAFYTDTFFHCSTCEISMGVYKMLTEYSGYNKAQAMEIINKFQ